MQEGSNTNWISLDLKRSSSADRGNNYKNKKCSLNVAAKYDINVIDMCSVATGPRNVCFDNMAAEYVQNT